MIRSTIQNNNHPIINALQVGMWPNNFPLEISSHILSFLNAEGMQQAAKTCKSWTFECVTFAKSEELSLIKTYLEWMGTTADKIEYNQKDKFLGHTNSTEMPHAKNLMEVKEVIEEIRENILNVLKNYHDDRLLNLKYMPKPEKTPSFFGDIFDLAKIQRKHSLSLAESNLSEVAEELAEWGYYKKAMNITSSKNSETLNDLIRKTVCEILIKRFLFDKALEHLPFFQHDGAHELIFFSICKAMTEQGLFSKAMDLIKKDKTSAHTKVRTVLAISTYFLEGIEPIDKKQIEELIAYVQSVEYNVQATEEAYLTLVKCLVKVGFMEDAIKFTLQMESRNKVPVINFLCYTLTMAGDLDKAIEVSEMMPVLIAGTTPYEGLSIALAAKERFLEAIAMLRKTPQLELKKKTFNFVLHLQAIHECKTLLTNEDEWHALLNISRELMEDGFREEAIEATKVIDNLKIKSLALQFICKKMGTGCLDEAIDFANEIPDVQIRSYTLRDLAKYVYKSKTVHYYKGEFQNNQAVNIANTIPDEKIRTRTLLEVS